MCQLACEWVRIYIKIINLVYKEKDLMLNFNGVGKNKSSTKVESHATWACKNQGD